MRASPKQRSYLAQVFLYPTSGADSVDLSWKGRSKTLEEAYELALKRLNRILSGVRLESKHAFLRVSYGHAVGGGEDYDYIQHEIGVI